MLHCPQLRVMLQAECPSHASVEQSLQNLSFKHPDFELQWRSRSIVELSARHQGGWVGRGKATGDLSGRCFNFSFVCHTADSPFPFCLALSLYYGATTLLIVVVVVIIEVVVVVFSSMIVLYDVVVSYDIIASIFFRYSTIHPTCTSCVVYSSQ